MTSSFVARTLSCFGGVPAFCRDFHNSRSFLGYFALENMFEWLSPKNPHKLIVSNKTTHKTRKPAAQWAQSQRSAQNTNQSSLAVLLNGSFPPGIEQRAVEVRHPTTLNSNSWHLTLKYSEELNQFLLVGVTVSAPLVQRVDHATPSYAPNLGLTAKGTACKTCDRKGDFCARHQGQRP